MPRVKNKAELQPFDVASLRPFYPATDESALANVGLKLPTNRRIVRRQQKRLTALLKKTRNAVATIERLPASDESLHCVLNGEFALWDFVPAVLQLAGQPITELWIATLGFSKRNVQALADLVDAGQVLRLDVLCSHYFAAADAAIFAQMGELCGKHGFRLAAMRTHAKLLLIRTAGHSLVVESSANLRSCFNCEQASVFNDSGLYDFHRGWIDELLAKGAAE